jgi:hypothetical protein
MYLSNMLWNIRDENWRPEKLSDAVYYGIVHNKRM